VLTALTKEVTQAALVYLDERGCKPIEPEVPVCDGWIADLAAVLSPTCTELILLKLMKRRLKCQGWNEWRDEASKLQRLMTVLVEVKTSRADFRSDLKWKKASPTNLSYLAIPNDLPVEHEEVPSSWGILSYSQKSQQIKLVRTPSIREASAEQQLNVILEIALKRDHATRYERFRELQKMYRRDRNEEISRMRVMTAMRAMQSIVAGKYGSLKDALEYHGIRNFPDYYLKELEKLWGIQNRPLDVVVYEDDHN
jgi:hypothetical protein